MNLKDSIQLNDKGDAITILGITYHEDFFRTFADRSVAGHIFMVKPSGDNLFTMCDLTVAMTQPVMRMH